ncbi:hypothetical protein DH09_13785 [Bacillaceae bacterium JMAK1]|nr:hypothetical protein DH09_13785 [Bacillaceae bacterium JMAK1]
MNEQDYEEEMQKRVQDTWPEGLPKNPTYPFGEVPLTEYLRRRAEKMPTKTCINYYGYELSFSELYDHSQRFAAYLRNKGIKTGDRVAVYLPNCPQFIIAFYGILAAGAVHVPVNPMFKEHELRHELEDSGAVAVITLETLYDSMSNVLAGIETIVTTSLSDYTAEHPTLPLHPDLRTAKLDELPTDDWLTNVQTVAPLHDDYSSLDALAALNYTGGTTGMPKGCMHTQANMLYTMANSYVYNYNLSEDDVRLGYLPVFWIAGENAGVLMPVFSGATLILLYRWDKEAVFQAIETYKVTSFGGVTDNIVQLMEDETFHDRDLSSLTMTTVSSFIKKVTKAYREQWFNATGTVMRETSFGMTETHTSDTFTQGMQTNHFDLESRPIFVGLPMPGTKIKIVDFDTKQRLPLEQEGEIAISTPSLMKGYWGKDEAVGEWFYTGDIGVISETGYLHYIGRKKDMLKVNGMSVFPAELEHIISRHEHVNACAVVGKVDDEKGQIPVAFIQLRSRTTQTQMEKFLIENLSGYKVPEVILVDEMPLTTTGKIKKEVLRKRLEKENNHARH